MRNHLALGQVLLLLPLLSKCDDVCSSDRDDKFSMAHISVPECWNDNEYLLQIWCDCGSGYLKKSNGGCQRGLCSPGFKATANGDCVRCPHINEKWCSVLNKCICNTNHHLDEYNDCVPCANDEISNGTESCRKIVYKECDSNEFRNITTKECQCNAGYGQNEMRRCIYCAKKNNQIRHDADGTNICTCRQGYRLTANGNCQRRFGIVFCSVGFVIVSIVGLIFGYALGQNVRL